MSGNTSACKVDNQLVKNTRENGWRAKYEKKSNSRHKESRENPRRMLKVDTQPRNSDVEESCVSEINKNGLGTGAAVSTNTEPARQFSKKGLQSSTSKAEGNKLNNTDQLKEKKWKPPIRRRQESLSLRRIHSDNKNEKENQNVFPREHNRSRSLQRSKFTVTGSKTVGSEQDKIDQSYLEKLRDKSSLDNVTALMKHLSSFGELLSSTLNEKLILLIFEVLRKVCECKYVHDKVVIFTQVCQPKILESIQVQMYKIPINNQLAEVDVENFISNILVFCEQVMHILPKRASKYLKAILITSDLVMNGLETYKDMKLHDKKEHLYKLLKILDAIIETCSVKTVIISGEESLQIANPPENYRKISIFPTKGDLVTKHPPFLRPNVLDGAYMNVEHYLDIQFRLLREDFLIPLREGVVKLLETSSKSGKVAHIDYIKVYKNVKFGNPKIIGDKVGRLVLFDHEKKIKCQWKTSKRLMFGSLLLLTNDNFQSVIFATVLEREITSLMKGEVTVFINENNESFNLDGFFLMIESEVFFEPYKHVMNALKKLNDDNFPMKRYIVSLQMKTNPPKYLLNNRCLFKIGNDDISILDKKCWPNDKNLDKSQFTAFQAALTEDFVIVQGPPGTGKTFIGLQIAKVLLENPIIWNKDKTPILVVCYTNHALDQFLEGILKETTKIVRIGGQSKCEALADYNMRVLRRKHKYKSDTFFTKGKYFDKMASAMKSMKTELANLNELEKQNGIVSPSVLMKYNIITFQQYNNFEPSVNVFIVKWLTEGIEECYGFNLEENYDNECEKIEDGEILQRDNTEEAKRIADIQDEFLDFDFGSIKHNIMFAINFQEVEKYIKYLMSCSSMQNHPLKDDIPPEEIAYSIYIWKLKTKYLKMWLEKEQRCSDSYIARLHNVQNLWSLSVKDRWLLYKDWVNALKDSIRASVNISRRGYQFFTNVHEELSNRYDLEIIQRMLVVGMTTTSAARLHSLLQSLNPKIVIVEEAAEVLESHIVVSLTKECDHLILIGDHQQLRPSPATFKLAKDYHLDVSLFERMINNGFRCYCLENQHRMRPEIARLISPAIYKSLKNHESVNEYPAIGGVTKSLFFVTHDIQEEKVVDSTSHKNSHEALFLISLCKYFICQGYEAEEITILTPYVGQMLLLKQNQNHLLNGVLITTIDNYQGEENKIILLSLVRSNHTASIGFLKIENRVCVALSRAREGLFIIGNMDNLEHSSNIWPQIKMTLLEQESYGTSLTLQCQNHNEQKTPVSCASDFDKVPEGGCSLSCNADLECGHVCDKKCHIIDRDHKMYKCLKACERRECPLQHECTKMCWEDCGKCETMLNKTLLCGHMKTLPCHQDAVKYKCLTIVEDTLPDCGHTVKKPCFEEVNSFTCYFDCEKSLPCGHICSMKCHVKTGDNHLMFLCKQKCNKKNPGCPMMHMCTKLCYEDCGTCNFVMDKTLPMCNHICKVTCSQDLSTVKCWERCSRKLQCGHFCHKKCYEPCGDCEEDMEKILPGCGHSVKVKCCTIPHETLCKEACLKYLPCGHRCRSKCGELCSKQCNKIIDCPIIPICGHDIKIPCHLKQDLKNDSEELLKRCMAPCKKTLSCGHTCNGTCGKCIQGRIHIECSAKCERYLICGHKCPGTCSSPCLSCSEACQYRCSHLKCGEICGTQCTPCMEPCDKKCEHSHCRKLCYELCDRNACYEPCQKVLKCGHDCIGYCGDICPPVCRICDVKLFPSIGVAEENKAARFVYLVDCKHTVESNNLEKYMHESENRIAFKQCPQCQSYILHTPRFINHVKKTYRDITSAKMKIHFKIMELEKETRKPMEIIEVWEHWKEQNGCMSRIKTEKQQFFHTLIQNCTGIASVQKHKYYNLSWNEVLKMKHFKEALNGMLTSIFTYLVKEQFEMNDKVLKKINSYFYNIVEIFIQRKNWSDQVILDINRESKRFMMFTQLILVGYLLNPSTLLKGGGIYKNVYKKAYSIIISSEVYSDEKDLEMQKLIEELRKVSGVESSAPMLEISEFAKIFGLRQDLWLKCPNSHVYCREEYFKSVQICPLCKC